jgi:hypothetical protein
MNEAKCGARFVQHWKPDCAALIQATLATSLRRAEPYPSKEACVGAHHLSRKPKGLGHDARLMPAKYVRPYSKGQKNEFREAEAIAEAVQRPTMKFVATKTADQLDLQALHRVRERLVSQRTGIINQIRAFLLERGVAVRQGQRFLRAELPRIPLAFWDDVARLAGSPWFEVARAMQPWSFLPLLPKVWLGSPLAFRGRMAFILIFLEQGLLRFPTRRRIAGDLQLVTIEWTPRDTQLGM